MGVIYVTDFFKLILKVYVFGIYYFYKFPLIQEIPEKNLPLLITINSDLIYENRKTKNARRGTL